MPLHLQRIYSDVSSKSSNALQQSPNTRGAFWMLRIPREYG